MDSHMLDLSRIDNPSLQGTFKYSHLIPLGTFDLTLFVLPPLSC